MYTRTRVGPFTRVGPSLWISTLNTFTSTSTSTITNTPSKSSPGGEGGALAPAQLLDVRHGRGVRKCVRKGVWGDIVLE